MFYEVHSGIQGNRKALEDRQAGRLCPIYRRNQGNNTCECHFSYTIAPIFRYVRYTNEARCYDRDETTDGRTLLRVDQ